jgi:hypothetical protein
MFSEIKQSKLSVIKRLRIIVKINFVLVFLGMLTGSTILYGQSDSVKVYVTSRISGEAPKIDGKGNDAAWEQVPWGGGDFRQNQPNPGKEPSVQTRFKILYDEKNLYVLILNLDPEPEKIVKRMSRRDGFEGDFVEINIDSYYDKRTAFSFTASVSGVKGDEYVSNDGNNWDANWDPIWYLHTSIIEEGWIAEMRIPLSQLRFGNKDEHVWGLQVTRRFFRNEERSLWQYISPDASGWVHLFGELRGITGIKPQKQLEVQPYVLAKTERFEKEEGNPFRTGTLSTVDFGLDAKIGITSDITLDLTVNPDFGQVEADPSQVNLSAFRLFFQERRPFFIEGNNTLNFPITDFSSNNLFYSRRIGRNPQGDVDTDESGEDDVDEFVKPNNNTTILGAAKITGKNKKGFSWGLLESVTAKENGVIDSLGHRREIVTEPLTNYLVARAQQDINKGNTIIGGMFTSVHRDINEDYLKWLHKDALSGGIDFVHNWKDRKYFVSGRVLMSHVTGDPEAITVTQEASERYFQRPDNNHADVETHRKSLTGTGGTFLIGKRSGRFVYETGYNWNSPQLELNDIGFLNQTDVKVQWTWMQYRFLTPKYFYRSMRINAIQWFNWDYDNRKIGEGYEINGNIDFKNFWFFNTMFTYDPINVSNADLRGGPALHYPGSMRYSAWLSTDPRKKLRLGIGPSWTWGFDGFQRNQSIDFQINYKPVNALAITILPSFSKMRNKMQYVTTGETETDSRYVVAQIDQTIARMSVRMTYMLTPNLSIQYWGQPFGTAGKYSHFKYVTNADAPRYSQRIAEVPSEWLHFADDVYHVDENVDGSAEFEFDKPDFNFGQFRSNMVIRWEYIPGSTLFLVWTQEMNGEFYDRSESTSYHFNFDTKAHNIFLVKYTYRFVL